MKLSEIDMQIICPKCDNGTQYCDNDKVLKNGTVISKVKCTNCNHVITYRFEPEHFQRQKRVREKVMVKNHIKQLEQEYSLAEDEMRKRIFEMALESWRNSTQESFFRNKMVDNGEPILVHEHDNYGRHPISVKHKKKRGGTIIAVKKFVTKKGKRYGPYPKEGHYYYEVFREGNKVKQRFIGKGP